MQTILTIDIGSTNMKAVLFDHHGRLLHICSRGTQPDYLDGQRVELNARKLREIFLSLLAEVCVYQETMGLMLTAVSVTAQRSSVVPVDAKGEPLSPIIMWHDKRTTTLCHQLHQFEERVFALSGMTISPVYSAVKMLWIKEYLPEVYSKTAKMLGIQDFLLHTLCGRFVSDHSLASSTNLLNIHSCQWDRELLHIFSVKRGHLCDLVEPGAVCGKTTEWVSKETGIPSGVPVISAGGDQQCGALGQGVFSPGKVKCTTGTGSYLMAFAKKPIIDKQKRFVCKVGAVPGTYYLEAGIFTTGTVYRWFTDQFYREVDATQGLERINAEAVESPPGANGVIVLPHFEGSGAPYWNSSDRGTFHNIRLSTTRGDIARAILEAIVMETRNNLQVFEDFIGGVDLISVAGGMASLTFYNQLQADILGSKVITYANTEATAFGAWMSAAVATGIFHSHAEAFKSAQLSEEERIYSPDPSLEACYSELCTRRKALYEALQGLH
jgi:sugar (pentulose or hexulose) kinase